MRDLSNQAIEGIARRFREEPYARKMGLRLLELEPGHAVVEMDLGQDSTNLLDMPHGGAIFSLIDAAFEVSSNSHGTVAVALNCAVSFLKTPRVGDVLRAESREASLSRQIGTYFIEVRDSEGRLIATCNAMAFRKPDPLPFLKHSS